YHPGAAHPAGDLGDDPAGPQAVLGPVLGQTVRVALASGDRSETSEADPRLGRVAEPDGAGRGQGVAGLRHHLQPGAAGDAGGGAAGGGGAGAGQRHRRPAGAEAPPAPGGAAPAGGDPPAPRPRRAPGAQAPAQAVRPHAPAPRGVTPSAARTERYSVIQWHSSASPFSPRPRLVPPTASRRSGRSRARASARAPSPAS